jgi:hypothetical protein
MHSFRHLFERADCNSRAANNRRLKIRRLPTALFAADSRTNYPVWLALIDQPPSLTRLPNANKSLGKSIFFSKRGDRAIVDETTEIGAIIIVHVFHPLRSLVGPPVYRARTGKLFGPESTAFFADLAS